jgi:hypothetical protein
MPFRIVYPASLRIRRMVRYVQIDHAADMNRLGGFVANWIQALTILIRIGWEFISPPEEDPSETAQTTRAP